jgi:hypothetical protein
MGKLLLNLTLGEELSMVKKLHCFYDPIELDVLLEGALHISVHDLINGRLFNLVRIEIYRGQVHGHIQFFQERWKILVNQFHIKY